MIAVGLCLFTLTLFTVLSQYTLFSAIFIPLKCFFMVKLIGIDIDASSIATKETGNNDDDSNSGRDSEEDSSMSLSVSSRPRARTSSNLDSVVDGTTMPALVSRDSISVASSGASSHNKKMSKINKLSSLLGLKTFKSPKKTQKKKDKIKSKSNTDGMLSEIA